MRETIHVVRRLLAGDSVTFDGPVMSELRLTQPGGIELGLAGNSSFERPGLRREGLWASS